MKIAVKKIIRFLYFMRYAIIKSWQYIRLNMSVFYNYILHDNDRFENELSIVAIVKNEALYIKEWIEYHKIVGVEKFYIYDNESTDNLIEVLKSYIDSAEVVYLPFKGIDIQHKAYEDARKRFRNKTKWFAVIDVDEFIVPVSKAKITDVLDEIKQNVLKGKPLYSLAMHWVMYGFSGYYKKPEGLVIENYTKSDGVAVPIKCISNPRTVTFLHGHCPFHFFRKRGINEKGIEVKSEQIKDIRKWVDDINQVGIEHIRVNHYFTKSYEEYIAKLNRNRTGFPNCSSYSLLEFDPDYLSHHEDRIMAKYIPMVKENCRKV